MVTQNDWVYCKETTEQHKILANYKYDSCLQEINDIITNEGGKNPSFSDKIVINLDGVETLKAQKEKRNKRATVDMVFGISNGNRKQMLLTELRLKYKNLNNLKRSDLNKKIEDSKALLGHEPVIHGKYIFVFQSKRVKEAKDRIRELNLDKSTHVAVDVSELKSKYFQTI